MSDGEVGIVSKPDQADQAQAVYIQKLEERLAALEQRIVDIESAKKEQNESIRDDDSQAEETREPQPEHPPYPPTVPEVRCVNFVQAFHHDLTAPEIPALEFMAFTEKSAEQDPKCEAFQKSLVDMTPTKALETINTNYAKPYELDLSLPLDQLRVLSRPLGEFLWPIIAGDSLLEDHIAILQKPFAAPIYYHDEVKSKLKEMEEAEADKAANGETDESASSSKLLAEVKTYVWLMEDTILPYYDSFKTKTAADNLKVYFNDLWHLFTPGEIIYYPEAKINPSVADYEKLHRSKRPDQKLWKVYTRYQNEDKYWIKAYCIDYDGDSYVCVKEWFTIDKYEGKMSANSLAVYPVRYSTNAKKLMDDAIEGGRGFLRTHGLKLLGHTGWSSVWENDSTSLIYVSGDVVIDFAEAFKAHPDWKPISKLPATYYLGNRGADEPGTSKSKWYWTEDQELKEFSPLTVSFSENQMPRLTKRNYCLEEDKFLSTLIGNETVDLPGEDLLCLLPSRLFGYSLQDRRFVALDVKNLREIEENRDKFKNLIINPDHEGMLRALVESHFRRKDINETATISTTNQDIVQNKGRGLVILLHGVPGVGKTSTAEMIASNFQRPLLPITCGDLGLDPAAVEKSLKQMFRVAQLWDCILLLDEADVFLSERVSSDLSRNALVSGTNELSLLPSSKYCFANPYIVFLRVLDYYSGILFLTTNRVGTIDEAFKSRIHISLYYPYLDLDQTEKIWAVNLDRLAMIEAEQSSVQEPLSIDRDEILTFAKRHYEKSRNGKGRWNGRQIRNAFLIASALAHYEKTHGIRKDDNKNDLTARHFRTVVKAGTGFEKYLFETRGMTDQEAAYINSTRADHVLSPEAGHLPRTPAPTSAQPIKPPMHPAWANQYPTHQAQPFTPPRNHSSYNLAPSPANNMYPQQPPPPQHYVYETAAPPDTFGQPSMATGYPPQRAVTPGSQGQPHGQPVGQVWNAHHPTDYDSDI